MGHSEGGAAAMMAAAQSDDIAFVVTLAGLSTDGLTSLRLQNDAIIDAYPGWRFRSKGPQKTDDYFGVKPPKKDFIINKKGRELGSRASNFRSIATQIS